VVRISDLNEAYDPLHFVLLHPHGELGWGPHRWPGAARRVRRGRAGRVGVAAAEQDAAEAADGPGEQPPADAAMEGEPAAAGDGNQLGPQGIAHDIEEIEAGINAEIEAELANAADGDGGDAPHRGANGDRITARDYAAFLMHDRDPPDNCLIVRGKRLFQEWLCDMYAKVESHRLAFQRFNQHTLRVDEYRGVVDAVARAGVNENPDVGRPVILSSSFRGGPRHMSQLYQDAMALVRAHGKPDLFITMTCNPAWPEIANELKPNEVANDRPDLVARVFRLKLKSLLDDLEGQSPVFGSVRAMVHVVEWQKRGLPHAHILLILGRQSKPTAETYDNFVSAQLPDPVTHPRLAEAVKCFMLHGPCGVHNLNCPCMDRHTRSCTKRYPKEFLAHTTDRQGSYPVYARPDNGRQVRKGNFSFDNRWVVPYNPYLLLKYNCHINVEICSSVTAVKYLYKYVYKGTMWCRLNCATHEMKSRGTRPRGMCLRQRRLGACSVFQFMGKCPMSFALMFTCLSATMLLFRRVLALAA
jgi:Helitron helicase-like domain at N-terminus